MSDDKLLQILLHTKVFQGLSEEDLGLFCRYFQRVSFKENDILVGNGRPIVEGPIVVKNGFA